ncbi:MAG: hypothetical protein ACI89J_002273 [Hyphomicrobiaceae bacterium]
MSMPITVQRCPLLAEADARSVKCRCREGFAIPFGNAQAAVQQTAAICLIRSEPLGRLSLPHPEYRRTMRS